MTDEIWQPLCPAGHEAKIAGAQRVAGTSIATWQDGDIERPEHMLVQVECTTCEPTWKERVVRPLED